jgi:hypothetical protein
MRIENLEVADYINDIMASGGPDTFKKNVMKDLDTRRDRYAPEESRFEKNVA